MLHVVLNFQRTLTVPCATITSETEQIYSIQVSLQRARASLSLISHDNHLRKQFGTSHLDRYPSLLNIHSTSSKKNEFTTPGFEEKLNGLDLLHMLRCRPVQILHGSKFALQLYLALYWDQVRGIWVKSDREVLLIFVFSFISLLRRFQRFLMRDM